MRAHLVRREDNETDDFVNVLLDTNNDQRRGYMFGVNAYGVQWDALWTEGQGYDKTVDLLWDATTRRTAFGFVAMFSIPFDSLRFPDSEVQEWRLMLGRAVQAADDESFWPRFSTRVEGRLNQAGVIRLTQVTGGYTPSLGQLPVVVDFNAVGLTSLFRPGHQLTVQSSYLFTQLAERQAGERVLSNHVLRTRWHLQLTPRTSVRAIVRYERTIASAARTSVPDAGDMNADVLFTWMLSPWTAVYAGYNGNAARMESNDGIRRMFRRDADQVFVKVGYLWRP
jgi:hypothetical protein